MWEDTAVSKVDYWDENANTSATITAWDFEINDGGEFVSGGMGTVANNDKIGYDSSITLERFCLPASKVLSEAFGDYLEDLTGALSKGEFANLVTDVKNVTPP